METRLPGARGWLALSWATIAVLSSTGCDSADRASVTGTLLRTDGTPLVGARVIARSNETGKSAYATTNDQGQYALGVVEEGDGIPPGDYDVLIIEDSGDPDNRRPQSIASKYRDPAASGLRLSVIAGEKKELNLTLDPE